MGWQDRARVRRSREGIIALVVLIERPEELLPEIEADMRRWWRGHCVKITRDGETWFAVSAPLSYNVREGIKRLASFGVSARAAYR